MGVCSGWSWISQIISWHVDGLHRCDRSGLSGGNALLEHTKISGKSWLITDSRWDTSEKSRHFRASLGESEDIINEKKHIFTLFISEILSEGDSSKSDTSSGTWWLVHLSVDKGSLGAWSELNDTRLNHFVVKIITLSCSFSDTSEHGETTVKLSNVVNQLHNEYSLSDTGTSEETDFTSFRVWSQKVDNLNTYIIIFISKVDEPKVRAGRAV